MYICTMLVAVRAFLLVEKMCKKMHHLCFDCFSLFFVLPFLPRVLTTTVVRRKLETIKTVLNFLLFQEQSGMVIIKKNLIKREMNAVNVKCSDLRQNISVDYSTSYGHCPSSQHILIFIEYRNNESPFFTQRLASSLFQMFHFLSSFFLQLFDGLIHDLVFALIRVLE